MRTVRNSVLAFLLATLSASGPAFAADTPLADPKPSWDAPRKIMLQLTEDEPKKVNSILSNAINLQKFYGPDNLRVAIIAYGNGVRALLAATSPVRDRIKSLQEYEVEFVACGNTLAATGRTPADVLNGVTVATAGIAEITERQLTGWTYIVP